MTHKRDLTAAAKARSLQGDLVANKLPHYRRERNSNRVGALRRASNCVSSVDISTFRVPPRRYLPRARKISRCFGTNTKTHCSHNARTDADVPRMRRSGVRSDVKRATVISIRITYEVGPAKKPRRRLTSAAPGAKSRRHRDGCVAAQADATNCVMKSARAEHEGCILRDARDGIAKMKPLATRRLGH